MCWKLKLLYGGMGWMLAAAGTLFVAEIPYDPGESFCGIWGCYPPFPPLAAMHLLWAAILGWAVWTVRIVRPCLLRPLGYVVFLTALVATIIVVGRDLISWLDWLPASAHHLWPRRVAYTLATNSDLPLVQALIAGMVGIVLGRKGVCSRKICTKGESGASVGFLDVPKPALSTLGDKR